MTAIFLLFSLIAALPPSPDAPDPRAARADSLLTALVAEGFSGVVLVAVDGVVVLEEGYGLADRGRRVPMTPSTVVQIGSNTKDFTTISILQLQERGVLRLSDPITRWFDDVPAEKRAITIGMLLDHRAGFAQFLGPDSARVTRDQIIRNALASELAFEPGTSRSYSNVGYALLAAIIEMETGSSYDEYVRDNILEPIGLTDTGFLMPGFAPGRLARGYQEGRDMGTLLEHPHAPDGPYWNLRGNGGMLSTVGDMYRFYQAIFANRLLRPESRGDFYQPDAPLMLAGSDRTSFFMYGRYPRAGVEIIVASNATDYPAPRVSQQLAAIFGIAPPPGARTTSPGVEIETGPARPPAPAASGSATLPDGPVGEAARRLLAAQAASSDAAAVRRFLEESVAPRAGDTRTIDERVRGFQAMAQELGTLTFERVDHVDAGSIAFTARSSVEGVVTFRVQVEAAPPHRITGIGVEAR